MLARVPSVTTDGTRPGAARTATPRDSARTPILFVHGLGHGAWCWEPWMDATAAAGYPSFAVSLRGHGASPGRLRTALLSHYVEDVVTTAAARPGPRGARRSLDGRARGAAGAGAVRRSGRRPGRPDSGTSGRGVPEGHRPAASHRRLADRGRRYGAPIEQFPGMGHDLMLDARWQEPLTAMLGRLETAVPGR